MLNVNLFSSPKIAQDNRIRVHAI